MKSFRGSASDIRIKMAERIEVLEKEVRELKSKLQDVGHIVELDPEKWYWMIVNVLADVRNLEDIRKEDGNIILTDDLKAIKFVENPDRIKGIIVVKDFDDIPDDVAVV